MTYRAGVIGFGRVGRNHAEAFMTTDGIELGAIADADETVVDEMGDHWGIPEQHRYHSHSAMLASERLDAVSVATPDMYHHDHVLAAVRSSADPAVIWCEKPIATSVRRAEEMVTACEENGIELVINHSRRFSSAYETLHTLLHEQRLLGGLRSAQLVAGPELLNMGTHYVDLLLYLLDAPISDVRGGRVTMVEADGKTRFKGGGTLLHENGITASVEPGSSKRLYVEGTDGRVSIPLSIAPHADHEWRYWSEGSSTARPHQEGFPEPLGEMWHADISGTHTTYTPGDVPAQTLFENAAVHIVDLIAGRGDNSAPGRQAAHGLAALVGMVLSDYSGARVLLPLDRPFRELPLLLD